MAGKKRAKPIRISLTEEQIAEVIRNTVKSRKGFSIESLEDRIAPSRIGLPIGGGFEDPSSFGGGGPEVGGGDPTTVGGDPTTVGGEPPLPGAGGPPLPGSGEPPLPGADPDLPGAGGPPLPGLNPGVGSGGFDPLPGDGLDPLPGDPMGGGLQHHLAPHDPLSGGVERHGPAGEFGGPQDSPRAGLTPEQRQDPRLRHDEPSPGPDEVSPEQLQQHRQAILRQLRGGQG